MSLALSTDTQCPFLRMEIQEASMGPLLIEKDEQAFEQVFKTHFKNLLGYAFSILKDEMAAEEMVQQVFFKLWERADHLSFNGSVVAYLYRAVHNESLNHLKHLKVRARHQLHVAYQMKVTTGQQQEKHHDSELEQQFRLALSELPEQCRTVFQLSRFEDLKYREIADKLDISVKTVENHMGKALKLLRARLVDFLTLALLLFNY